ncbi:MAG: neutral zinc metallopeptidase [Pseudomonadota bacterium]
MRWKRGRRSQNVDDRRGRGSSGPMFGRRGRPGGGMRLPMNAKGGSGCTTILVVLAVLYFMNSGNSVLSPQSGNMGDVARGGYSQQMPQSQTSSSAANNELADFVSVVLADTEDTWHMQFQRMGKQYQEPQLVLFTQQVRSACGRAHAASGPFYCPGDRKLYIDLSFYEQLKRQHNAPGDFAQAYVIAHEVAHHVQTLLGISQQVEKVRRRASKQESNKMLVRLELQADCLAGLWAHHAQKERQILEQGDIEEALNAASQIGDDVLQRQAQGYVVPASFTHGTSEQRMRWFKIGFSQGQLAQCDTFNARTL